MANRESTPQPQLLGKKQLNLGPQGPIAGVVRMHAIIERLQIDIQTLFPDSQYFSSAPAQWHCPAFTRRRLPIGRYDGRTRQVPTARKIEIDEWLGEELMHICSIAFTADGSAIRYK
jgi:hypothetical protein